LHKTSVKSLFDIKKSIHLKECSSTNDFLINLNSNSTCKEGMLVSADFQTNGRGQRNNKWTSEKNANLTFSLLIEPKLQISYQFYLNIISSLTIHEVLFSILGSNIKIKWPNDIYYKNKKVAGILVENIVKNKKIQKSIIGFGINVNQIEFPISNAISIFNVKLTKFSKKKILKSILIEFEKNYNLLKNKKYETLFSNYSKRLFMLNKTVICRENKNYMGVLIGITKFGKLLIKVNDDYKEFSVGDFHINNNV
tara:strand:+ start:1516 stop:2274 length:759 start_codon:yes stop_codon:yes gene_type:complete